MSLRHFLTMSFAAIALSACSHSPRMAEPTGLKAADFWIAQKRLAQETSPVAGKIRLHYRAKKQSLTGRGRVVAELPEHVSLELRDPLGRLAYAVALEGQRVVAYYPTQKKAFFDERAGVDYLKEVFAMELSFRELQEVFVGLLPGQRDDFDRWDWDAKKGLYRGVQKGKNSVLTAWIDGSDATIRELRFQSTTQAASVTYSDFDSCCSAIGRVGVRNTNVPVAQSIVIDLPLTGTGLEMHWETMDRLTRSPSVEAFRLSVPEGTQKVLLK